MIQRTASTSNPMNSTYSKTSEKIRQILKPQLDLELDWDIIEASLKSNQKNLGTIKSSNLCTEILEYSDEKETAVCNLASIALPMFVDEKTKEFNYENLQSCCCFWYNIQ